MNRKTQIPPRAGLEEENGGSGGMNRVSRRQFVGLTMIGVLLPVGGFASAAPAPAPVLDVYKSPGCGCCSDWVDRMKAAGFTTRTTEVDDLEPLKDRFSIPQDLRSCHTGLIDGYVVEGHVPPQEVRRLLAERPAATGLSVPGMPVGSPGMEQGSQKDHYTVVLFSPSSRSEYARY